MDINYLRGRAQHDGTLIGPVPAMPHLGQTAPVLVEALAVHVDAGKKIQPKAIGKDAQSIVGRGSDQGPVVISPEQPNMARRGLKPSIKGKRLYELVMPVLYQNRTPKWRRSTMYPLEKHHLKLRCPLRASDRGRRIIAAIELGEPVLDRPQPLASQVATIYELLDYAEQAHDKRCFSHALHLSSARPGSACFMQSDPGAAQIFVPTTWRIDVHALLQDRK